MSSTVRMMNILDQKNAVDSNRCSYYRHHRNAGKHSKSDEQASLLRGTFLIKPSSNQLYINIFCLHKKITKRGKAIVDAIFV
jgi:hypothetical protein